MKIEWEDSANQSDLLLNGQDSWIYIELTNFEICTPRSRE